MKIIVERDRLKEALHAVASQTKGSKIPILTHVLIDAAGSKLRIVGHSLDSCSEATIPAEVDTPGTIVIPCDRLNSVVSGSPAGSQVSIHAADAKQAKVKCGRSLYQFSLMSPGEFPDMLDVKDGVAITLTAQQVKTLLDAPAPCVETSNRVYLQGIYLHRRGKQLSGCATDGHTLACTSIDLNPPTFDGVIIPTKSCAEIVKVAGEDEVSLEIGRATISATSGDRTFVSKLIDGTFPDYERVIPQANNTPMVLDSKELDAALARIVAAADAEAKVDIVKLSWGNNPSAITVSLSTQGAQGNEEIECDASERPAGEVGLQCGYLRRLIDVTGGETIRLLIGEPIDPVRVENPHNADVVAVCMPCRV